MVSQMCKMFGFFTTGECFHDTVYVRLRQLVVVRHLDALIGRINEQRRVVGLAFLQNHNAGCNRRSEKQIARQLDDAVFIVSALKI